MPGSRKGRLGRSSWRLGRALLALACLAGLGAAAHYLPPGFGAWRLETLHRMPRDGHDGPVTALALAPRGDLVASGGREGSIRLWEPVAGRLRRVLREAGPQVTALALSPSLAHLASGTAAGELALWPLLGEAEPRLLLPGPGPAVEALAFSPDGLSLAAGRGDGTAVVREVASAIGVARLAGGGAPLRALRFAAEGKMLLGLDSTGVLRSWSLPSGELLARRAPPGAAPLAFAPGPGGRLALAGAGGLRLLDAATFELLAELPSPVEALEAVHLGPRGELLAVDSAGHILHGRAPTTAEPVSTSWESVLPESLTLGPFTRLALDHRGRRLASGGSDGLLRVREAVGSAPTLLLGAPALALAAGPRGRLAASSHGSGILGTSVIHLWNLSSGERLRTLPVPGRVATCLAFTPEGRRLELWAPRARFAAWDLATGELVPAPSRRGAPGCPPTHGRRFRIEILRQVGHQETALADTRTGLLLELSRSLLVAAEVPRRGLRDRLAGAFPLVAIDTEGALLFARARPRLSLAWLLAVALGWWPLWRLWLRLRPRPMLDR